MHKESFPDSSKRNVVYRINDCDASIGQTGRKLKTRISKYFNHIKRNTSYSTIIELTTHYNYEFRWEEVEILDVERNFNKTQYLYVYIWVINLFERHFIRRVNANNI